MKKRRSSSAAAGDATWATQPSSGKWSAAANWSPADVPTDTATFGASSETALLFPSATTAAIDEIAFADGAPAYTFMFTAPTPGTPNLTIEGAGVSNGSAFTQRFVVAARSKTPAQAQLVFTNSASAGGANVAYVCGPESPTDPAGGVIRFTDSSTAGSATFVVTTGSGDPGKNTVGAEVSFWNSSSASSAQFTVYGSTGTALRGDTFGNVVFHDNATAANAVFTNVGGTLPHGDGGNTQFYVDATAANGVFHNQGATCKKANGGDTAFDGTATAAHGHFHNYPAPASGGYGGVTSFNNNAPSLPRFTQGASAGNGVFYNYAAQTPEQGGGGHTYFEAVHGSPTAAHGMFINYGSCVAKSYSAPGHTNFRITLPQIHGPFIPDAGDGNFWNLPGTADEASGGSTAFEVYENAQDEPEPLPQRAYALESGAKNKPRTAGNTSGPSAANGTFVNVGAAVRGASGGQTYFSSTTTACVPTAGHARLVALGGSNGGYGGSIVFSGVATGGAASVALDGNGTLDIHTSTLKTLSIGRLQIANGGTIRIAVGSKATSLAVAGHLTISSGPAAFWFESGTGFAENTPYAVLTAPNLSTFTADQFTGNPVNSATPSFSINGDTLVVTFVAQAKKARASRRGS